MKEEKKLICIRFDNSLCLAFRTCVCLYSLYSRYRYSQRYIHISYKADNVEGVRSMRHVILMCVREAGECRCGRRRLWLRVLAKAAVLAKPSPSPKWVAVAHFASLFRDASRLAWPPFWGNDTIKYTHNLNPKYLLLPDRLIVWPK